MELSKTLKKTKPETAVQKFGGQEDKSGREKQKSGSQEGFLEVRKLGGQEGRLVNKTSPRPVRLTSVRERAVFNLKLKAES